ncbi:MAG: type II secretion system protein [Planctomycetes bacterium]|nr:type II secretion system protein [Planctomycetota bacterium]
MLIKRKTGEGAFTMVELLTVVSIISILVTLLMPSLNRAILLGRRAKSAAFVQELTGAAQSYQKDTSYYPGIRYPGVLLGNRTAPPGSAQTGCLTGSQVLAASVFGLYYTNVTDATVTNDGVTKTKPGTYVANVYVSYTKAKVIDETDYDLNDQFPGALPILYWPAVPGNLNDTTSAFRFSDNFDVPTSKPDRYTQFGIGSRQANWTTSITNTNMGNTSQGLPVAWNYDSFLIVGPSMDRVYFNTDDVANYGR